MFVKRILIATSIVISATLISVAQSSNSVYFAVWGQSVHGVQMSMALTNDTILPDAGMRLFVKINNASAEKITLVDDFTASLVSKSGEKYEIVHPIVVHFSVPLVDLNPGESHVWAIFTIISSDTKPGDYVLSGTRHFVLDKKTLKLESNSIKMRIISSHSQ